MTSAFASLNPNHKTKPPYCTIMLRLECNWSKPSVKTICLQLWPSEGANCVKLQKKDRHTTKTMNSI